MSWSFALLFTLVVAADAHISFDEVNQWNMKDAQRFDKSNNATCEECKEVVRILEAATANRTAQNQTVTDLDEVCEMFVNSSAMKQLCFDVIDLTIMKILPLLWKIGHGDAWNVPLTVCADIVKTCVVPCCAESYVPEQIRISFADNNQPLHSRQLTWVTLDDGGTNCTPSVLFWSNTSSKQISTRAAHTRTYTNGGWRGHIHGAVIPSHLLAAEMTYYYQVGCPAKNLSDVKRFRTTEGNIGKNGTPLRVVFVADMGYGPKSDPTVDSLIKLLNDGEGFDLILHYGDISYADLDEGHWDLFWRKVEPIASQVPYMTVPGNHELYWNFSAYKARAGWWMPRAGLSAPNDAMFYHFDFGPVRFVMLDSETWFDTPNISPAQVDWAQSIMRQRNSSQQPWMVVAHHRPLYCTSVPKFQCDVFGPLLRLQVEELYLKERVDIAFAGHQHNYERMYPVKGGRVISQNYTDATTPIYIVNGAAGNREGNFRVLGDQPWSAAHSIKRGYVVAKFLLASTATAQLSFVASADGTVVDEITLKKRLM